MANELFRALRAVDGRQLCAALILSLLLFAAASLAKAAEPVDFERDVAPLLIKHCGGCHGGNEPAGGLNLLARATAFGSGDSGQAAIVPSSVTESQLIARIEAGEMPPRKAQASRVSPTELATLKSWIAAGAAWPQQRTLSLFEFSNERRAGRDWWSLQPLARNELPAVTQTSWPRTPIDRFILAKLEQQGLQPAPEADRVTLIRRVMLDLLGLPPSVEEVEAFVSDAAPMAYERLIDRLLDSPHYGERWGRHWLDVVRFADSHGFEMNRVRRNAWPYRDYVIRSFNADKPYRQFILEQLAGDQIGCDVATGFLVAGPWDQVKSPNEELTLAQRQAELDDIVSTTAGTFLGLTVHCAMCHDHKFDPISQQDYYALQAVFAGVQHGERAWPSEKNDENKARHEALKAELAQAEKSRQTLVASARALAENLPAINKPLKNKLPGELAPVEATGNVDRFAPELATFVRFTITATNSGEPCLDELEIFSSQQQPQNLALASLGAKATASGVYLDGKLPIHQLSHVNDGLYGNSKSWISDAPGHGWVQIELPQATLIDRVQWARDREGRYKDRLAVDYVIEIATQPDNWHVVASSRDRKKVKAAAPSEPAVDQFSPEQAAEYSRLKTSIETLKAEVARTAPPVAYLGKFVDRPPLTHRLQRGEPLQKREVVSPGSIAAVGPPVTLSSDAPDAARRTALAQWIADERNPLTARVMVNRIWHYHFGQGIVPNPSDFGFNGGRPSHAELLDWLALEFLAHEGRPKHIHRLILLSAAYRQSSQTNPQAAVIDGGNKLLWRFSSRRLEAEVIRDTVLAVSGALDRTMEGPGFDLFEPNDNYVKVYTPKQSFGPAEFRRMVYQQKPRMQSEGLFGAFDCPDSSQSAPRRNTSTTALQALGLLNSSFTIQVAELFAERLKREAPESSEAQVRLAFALAFSRQPTADEQRAAVALVQQAGLTTLCRAIFNANELIFLP